MLASIAHRGPDQAGAYLGRGIGLGHVRLSIIDLEGGRQPIANEDESVWVVFSGEIFNYVELRRELCERGHSFRTHSDTEVIVHMYEEKGPACVESFNGDFAFALWDDRLERLMLARDRIGVRPLYHATRNGVLAFGSEVKALLQIPGAAPEIDPVALDQVFTFWFPLAPRTAFKEIQELPPGHVLLAGHESLETRRYWQMQFPPEAVEGRPAGESGLIEELRALLTDATRIRLRADVPVAAFLSGGLDSAAVTALAQNLIRAKLRTFSVAFEDAEFDESPHQDLLVRALRTDHIPYRCTAQSIGRLFPEVIGHIEKPILRTAPVPLFELARQVRSHDTKVVLTGEGADEVLAGYDIFKEDKVRRFWARRPSSRLRPMLLRRLYPYLPGLQAQPAAYLERFFRVGLNDPNDPFFSHLPRWNMTRGLRAFYSGGLRQSLSGYDALEDLRGQLPAEYSSWHPLSRAQYLEASYLLPGYILSSQGDRVTLAHGVEGRYPFLDHRIVDFAARVPPTLKLKVLKEKHILRRSMEPLLPPDTVWRPKQPYRAPDAGCFFGKGAPDYVAELLSHSAIENSGYFDPAAVAKLVRKARESTALGVRDGMAIVGILSAQLLHHRFVRNGEAPGAAPVRPVFIRKSGWDHAD